MADVKKMDDFNYSGEKSIEEHWNANLGDSHSGLVEKVFGYLKGEGTDPGARIVDVGCGYGNLEKALSGTFKDVTAIDISEKSVEEAKAAAPDFRYMVMDAQKGLPFKDKEFDFSVNIEVMQHVENPVGILKELMRVGKKTIITLPNGFWTELRPQTDFFYKCPNFVHFTERTIRNVIREFGGKIVKFEYVTIDNRWKFLRDIYPRFLSTGFFIVIENQR